mmetsp:Transcript_17370/g.28852  ORF Transcript_17370/g.28852 Transcript_17370/m.28852 type:complete len:181 (-) Transcript_17370:34-576(-)|eukprot:CAMPEP_0119013016 /NCGR_PEP_ID=MMETSP1176-20130426/7751_1 /TAXON_ID=265551 /ORGANISM="Synedropsis recta cf, Strain CCMP1620" /LENGTH=180 /DNA_ID=CAMNT_0006966065 /DNA_START=34 /DNA_END=576 /DNA_ORIENTATION=+
MKLAFSLIITTLLAESISVYGSGTVRRELDEKKEKKGGKKGHKGCFFGTLTSTNLRDPEADGVIIVRGTNDELGQFIAGPSMICKGESGDCEGDDDAGDFFNRCTFSANRDFTVCDGTVLFDDGSLLTYEYTRSLSRGFERTTVTGGSGCYSGFVGDEIEYIIIQAGGGADTNIIKLENL